MLGKLPHMTCSQHTKFCRLDMLGQDLLPAEMAVNDITSSGSTGSVVPVCGQQSALCCVYER